MEDAMTKHSPLSPARATAQMPAAAHPLPAAHSAPDSPPEQASHTSHLLLPDEAIVPVAERQDGWTPDRQRAFIEMLADTGCVNAAAASVGMSSSSAYRLRRRTDARAFDAAWDAALERSLERLFPTAIERALNGTLKSRWYHGEVIAQEHVVSERLLIWLLEKGAAMLGNSRARRAMREDWDSALEGVGLEGSRPPEPAAAPEPECAEVPPLRVWVEEIGAKKGIWLTNAPPQPGYDDWCRGRPGEPDFARHLDPEEQAALAASRAAPHVSPWQDERRRRFFGLPRVPVYQPEPDNDGPGAMIVAARRAGRMPDAAPWDTDGPAEEKNCLTP